MAHAASAAPVQHAAPGLNALGRLVGWLCEIPAALLVVAEIAILGGGAFSRCTSR
jgi:hypothetical protein